MKTDFFPKPTDLVQDTPLQHCINRVRDNILNHKFEFKPEYQDKRHFDVVRMFLLDHKWQLNLKNNEIWTITPLI